LEINKWGSVVAKESIDLTFLEKKEDISVISSWLKDDIPEVDSSELTMSKILSAHNIFECQVIEDSVFTNPKKILNH